MLIQYISSDVRIIKYMGANDCYDVVVERYGPAGTDPQPSWQEYWRTNEISNDYAYTEAQQQAWVLADHIRKLPGS